MPNESKQPSPMNAQSQTQFRPELSLKRRSQFAAPGFRESNSAAPFCTEEPHSEAALQAGWDKLYRARAILEREQSHLRDDRIALKGEIESLDMREQALAAREMKLRQLESLITLEQAEAESAKENQSAIVRFTRAPFDMARAVFGNRK
jgi:hypothetical protein